MNTANPQHPNPGKQPHKAQDAMQALPKDEDRSGKRKPQEKPHQDSAARSTQERDGKHPH